MDEPLSCRPLTTKVHDKVCWMYRHEWARWIQDGSDMDGRYNNESFGPSVLMLWG